MISELINKYLWLIDILMKSGSRGLTLKEIQDKWENRWDNKYSRKTFNNHKNALFDIFGIEIDCNRSHNTYRIKHTNGIEDKNAGKAWLINTFTVNNLLSLSKEKLSGRVAVEDIPSGHKYLTCIMDAMIENKEIQMKYKKYERHSSDLYSIRPYALKEFEKRWYLIGYCIEKEQIRVYGLDRITDIMSGDRQFVFPDTFDVEEYFYSTYGIYKEAGDKAEEIIFATTKREAEYLKDLPIHHTQEEIYPIPGELYPLPEKMEKVFSLRLTPNKQFISEILKHTDSIKILKPESLKKQIRENIANLLNLYEREF